MDNRSINSFTKAAWPSGLKRCLQIVTPLLILLASLCFPAVANGQVANASALSGQVVSPYGQPAPNAVVLICTITAVGIPCPSTSVTLYSDYNLSQFQPNPLSTDQFGNFKTFITAGLYQLQITLPGATAPFIYYMAAGPANGADYVLMHPTANQIITQPAGTSLTVNTLNSLAGGLNGTLGAITPNVVNGTTGNFAGNVNAQVENASIGYTIGGAAPLNHVLLGNGSEYIDSATIPWSVIGGGSGSGPFGGTGVPCPTSALTSIDCTSTQIITALAGGAVLTAPATGNQTIGNSNNGGTSLTISNPNTGASAGAELILTNGTDIFGMVIGGTGTGAPGSAQIETTRSGAGFAFIANNGPISFVSELSAPNAALLLDASNNATFGGDTTVDGNLFTLGDITDAQLTAGNCVQAGTAGILTTISTPCFVASATLSDQYNTVTGCNYPDDGANESCSMSVTLGTAMANTSYIVSCVEYTNGLSTAVLDNITTPSISSVTAYSFSERTQGSSSEWSAHNNYGKSFVCHAHHN